MKRCSFYYHWPNPSVLLLRSMVGPRGYASHPQLTPNFDQAKSKQIQDHDQLRVKLDQLAEQNSSRTEQFQKLFEAKDLEAQLLTAKLAHQEQLAAYEAKKGEALTAEMNQLRANEAAIKTEFAAYGQKFETLNKVTFRSTQSA